MPNLYSLKIKQLNSKKSPFFVRATVIVEHNPQDVIIHPQDMEKFKAFASFNGQSVTSLMGLIIGLMNYSRPQGPNTTSVVHSMFHGGSKKRIKLLSTAQQEEEVSINFNL